MLGADRGLGDEEGEIGRGLRGPGMKMRKRRSDTGAAGGWGSNVSFEASFKSYIVVRYIMGYNRIYLKEGWKTLGKEE